MVCKILIETYVSFGGMFRAKNLIVGVVKEVDMTIKKIMGILILVVNGGLIFSMAPDYDVDDNFFRPRRDVYDMSGLGVGGFRRETNEEYARRLEEEDREEYRERYAQEQAEEDARKAAEERARQQAFQRRIRRFRNRFKKKEDTTALPKAIRKTDLVGIARILKRLQEGELVDDTGDSGLCPLNLALWVGSAPAVMLLLDRGANLFMYDVDGNNALHTAVIAKKPALLTILLAAAKNHFSNEIKQLLDEENNYGYTALALAKELKDTQCEEILKGYMPWWLRIFS